VVELMLDLSQSEPKQLRPYQAKALELVWSLAKAGTRRIVVMQAKHPRTKPDALVQVCSVQALARRDIPEASLVIVDAAQGRARAGWADHGDSADAMGRGVNG